MPHIGTSDGAQFHVDLIPDECPLCHYAVEPRLLAAVNTGPGADTSFREYLDVAYKCVRSGCGRIFVARYGKLPESGHYRFRIALPITPKPPVLSEEIRNLSPNFVETYGQAAAAEQYKLNQVAGVGYRKALEFLIKDYCIARHPDSRRN